MSSSRVAEEWAAQDLAALDRGGLRRVLEPLSSAQGAVVPIGEEQLINFSSNDYLGLATHPALMEAGRAALEKYGSGSGASRLVVGDSVSHRALEKKLAEFERAPAAVLFNSGYAANVGTISALV